MLKLFNDVAVLDLLGDLLTLFFVGVELGLGIGHHLGAKVFDLAGDDYGGSNGYERRLLCRVFGGLEIHCYSSLSWPMKLL